MYCTYKYEESGNIVLLELIPDRPNHAKKLKYIHIVDEVYMCGCDNVIAIGDFGHIVHTSDSIDDLIAQTIYDILEK